MTTIINMFRIRNVLSVCLKDFCTHEEIFFVLNVEYMESRLYTNKSVTEKTNISITRMKKFISVRVSKIIIFGKNPSKGGIPPILNRTKNVSGFFVLNFKDIFFVRK